HSHPHALPLRTGPPTPASYTLSLHDALPIYPGAIARHALHRSELRRVARVEPGHVDHRSAVRAVRLDVEARQDRAPRHLRHRARSEEHTSELQSRENLVCRLLLEKKKQPA